MVVSESKWSLGEQLGIYINSSSNFNQNNNNNINNYNSYRVEVI